MNVRRISACIALVFLLGLLSAGTAKAAVAAATTAETGGVFDFDFEFGLGQDRPADGFELLLLSPRLANQGIGGLVTAYRRGNQLFLPLHEIARLLEIGIDLSRTPGEANGFVITQDRPFFLNVAQQDVVIGAKRARFNADDVSVRAEDIYVRSELLSSWLPVDFEVNPYAALLNIKPREPTPLELRLERERRLRQLNGGYVDPNYPRVANEYRLFDGPFINQTVTGYFSDSRAAAPRLGSAYSTFLSADLLYLETEGYITGNDSEGVADYRLSAGRRDYYGRLLGPIGAREVFFGDVFARSDALVARSRQVRGAILSNVPFNRANEPQAQTLRGSLPPGWTVELYQDGFLVDYRRADATGLYVFDSVPLHMGNNELRLVFYGPYGERREETATFNLAESLTPPGEFYYDVFGGADVFGEPTGSFRADYGLLDELSLAGGYSTLNLYGTQRQYVSVGGRGLAGPVFLRGDLAREGAGGLAGTLDGQTKVGIVNVSATHRQLTPAFVSELYPRRERQLQSGDGLALQSIFNPRPAVPLDVRLAGERESYYGGERILRLHNRASTVVQDTAASHYLTWSNSSTGRTARTDGVVSLSRQVVDTNEVRASGDFSYAIHPDAQPTGFQLRLQGKLGYAMVGQAGFTRYFQGASMTDAGVSREFDVVAVGLTTRYTHPGVWSAFVNATAGLGYVERQRRLYADAHPFGNSGALLVKAFLDLNANGTWDSGEPPVQNAGIFVGSINSKVRTGRDGMAFLRELQPYQPVNVGLLSTSLEDPSWVSTRSGVSIVPRPGRVAEVHFPVIPTGDIDGTVYYDRGPETTPLPGARVQLLRPDGAVVRIVTTEYDGFYLFEKVPAGTYQVRIAPEDVARLQGAPLDAKPVTLGAEGMAVSGLDHVIKLRP